MDEVIARVVGYAFAFLRSLVQGIWASIAGWLTSVDVVLTEEQSMTAQILLSGLVFAAVVTGLRWLEQVRGDKPWQKALRKVGQVLMLGTSALQPTYGKPAAPARLTSRRSNGTAP